MFIETSKLEKSQQNARRHIGKKAAEDLKSSILAHGLMQNLVVTEADNGKYRVIAGGRRLKAIRELQKEGRLPRDYAASCQITGDEHALEMSLAENTVRLAMHPADEFEAFAKLIGGGGNVEQVAERFGVTAKHVEQRLKLGQVSPKILQAYRAEKLTLESLMAFTVTDDHGRQLEVYESLEDWQGARQIRSMLTGQMTQADGKLAAFVGLDAYHEAGGLSRSDLFGDQVYLESIDVLNRLAAEKLDAIGQELEAEGWKWVEISPERDWEMVHRLDRIRPDDEDETYDAGQVQYAGCYVSLDADGRPCIERGLVKREDRKHVFAADASGQRAKGGMPATLRRDLEAYRQQAAQAEIASNRLIAFDLLVFTTASNVFGNCVRSGPDVHFRPQMPAIEEATKAGDALKGIEQGLPLGWLNQDSEAAQFEDFCRLTESEKLDLLAYCTAMTLKPQLGGEADTAYELALSLTSGNVAAYWRPAKASYLGRISRDELLSLGCKLLGEGWSQSRSKDKKSELAEQLERVFAEPEKYARNAEQLATLKSWLPSGMGFGVIAEPRTVKPRKRKAA